MSQVQARKRLFTENYRRPSRAGGQRLLGGQALAQAQRLSQPSMKPGVLGLSLFAQELLAVGLIGLLTAVVLNPPFSSFLLLSSLVWLAALIGLGGAYLLGGYRFRTMRSLFRSIAVGFAGVAVGLAGAFAAVYVMNVEVTPYVFWLISWGVLAMATVAGLRIWSRIRIHYLTRTGELEHRIVIVGGGAQIVPLVEEIQKERRKGRRLCGVFDDRTDTRSPDVVAGQHKMGDLEDLVEFARLARIDTVIMAMPQASHSRLMQLMSRLLVLPVDIRVLVDDTLPELAGRRRSKIGHFDLVELYKKPIDGHKALRKRVFDIVFALFGIVAFSPVMLVIAILIKLESRGPVLFKQKRHGFNNKPISVFKFRSMYTDLCDPTAVKAVRRGDARVTRIGRFIRRASIDELPQFFNVLKGDLSIVGPRPHATAARTGDIIYDQVSQAYSARHKVKPGVTGWAQINGWRGEMNSPEKIRKRVEHDLYYIENWSLWFDLKIAFMTPWSLITTKNAY